MIRDPRLLFLGTGTSSGVPAIGCDCKICLSEDPRDKRLRSSISVTWLDFVGEERRILIDTTPDLREQSLRNKIKKIDAVFFTHQHVDHTFGLDEIRRFNVTMGSPVDIYAERNVLEYIKKTFGHIFYKRQNHNQSFVANLIEHTVEPQIKKNIFGLSVTPIRLLHGRLPVLGYRFDAHEKIPGLFPMAYCTDVSSIPPETWNHLQGLELLVLDMLRERHHPTHMSLDRAVYTASQVGATQTRFIHMSHDLGHSETNARLPEGMKLSFDGESIFPFSK